MEYHVPLTDESFDVGRHPRGVRWVYWEGLDGEVVVKGCGGCVRKVTLFGVIIKSCHLGPRMLHQPPAKLPHGRVWHRPVGSDES